MIVIVGESCSGKTTLADYIAKHSNYKKLITYTTRPIRPNEVDGIDYHFVTEDEFSDMNRNNCFIEVATYNNWLYGCPRMGIFDDKIAVLSPSGFRQLKRYNRDLPIISIYLLVSRRCRLMKALTRGDDIEEAYRRNLSDVGMFDGIENEVDFIIDNDYYRKTPKELYEELIDDMNDNVIRSAQSLNERI